jgi:hypothetical protein
MVHKRFALPGKKVNFFKPQKGKRRQIISFKIDENVINQTLPQLTATQQALLSEIHKEKQPMSQVLQRISTSTGMKMDEVKREYETAFSKAREVALHAQLAQTSQKQVATQSKPKVVRQSKFAINWENPSSTPKGMSFFGREFNKALDKGLRRAEKQSRAGQQTPTHASTQLPLPHYKKVAQERLARAKVKSIKDYGVNRAYVEGMGAAQTAKLFGLTDVTVYQKWRELAKNNPELASLRKVPQKQVKQKTIGVREANKPILGERNQFIIDQYLSGMKLREIGNGMGVYPDAKPSYAATIAMKAVRQNPELARIREASLEQLRSVSKERKLVRQKAQYTEKKKTKPLVNGQLRQREIERAQNKERNSLILEQYLSGAPIRILGQGLGVGGITTPASAYAMVKQAVHNDPSLKAIREQSLLHSRGEKTFRPKRALGQRTRGTGGQRLNLTPEEEFARTTERGRMLLRSNFTPDLKRSLLIGHKRYAEAKQKNPEVMAARENVIREKIRSIEKENKRNLNN